MALVLSMTDVSEVGEGEKRVVSQMISLEVEGERPLL